MSKSVLLKCVLVLSEGLSDSGTEKRDTGTVNSSSTSSATWTSTATTSTSTSTLTSIVPCAVYFVFLLAVTGASYCSLLFSQSSLVSSPFSVQRSGDRVNICVSCRDKCNKIPNHDYLSSDPFVTAQLPVVLVALCVCTSSSCS